MFCQHQKSTKTMCSHAQVDNLSLWTQPIWVVIHRNVSSPMQPLTMKNYEERKYRPLELLHLHDHDARSAYQM